MHRSNSILLALGSALLVGMLILSGIAPYDRATWLMEVAPVLIALPILWATRKSFPLTSLLYTLIIFHCMVLIIGGHYTYARVPIGFHVAELFELERNPYDKLGHVLQGFVPALLAREIFVRGKHINGPKMLFFLTVCVALAISATYELLEWGSAVALGQEADDFIGAQGDPWDTQSDMLCALLGAVSALALFSRMDDRQIKKTSTATIISARLRRLR